MRYIFLIMISSTLLLSCGQNNKKKNVTVSDSTTKDSITSVPINSPAESSLDTAEIISAIEAEVKRINSMSLTKKSYTMKEGECDFEARIDYFHDSTGILKISTKYFIPDAEGGSTTTETFYFQNRKFIFSQELWKNESTLGPGAGPPKGENRKYAYHDKIIRALENNSISKEEFDDLDNNSEEYKILDAFTDKKFAKAFCGE